MRQVVVGDRTDAARSATAAEPMTIETVQGTPIEAYGRTFTPVARVISAFRHRGTVRAAQAGGSGWGVVLVIPLGVVESGQTTSERDGEARTLPIPDRTGQVLQQMAILAIVVPILAWGLIWINRLLRRR